MGYRIKKKQYHLACSKCLCMRCNAIACPYESMYKCFPNNAGCMECMRIERNEPLLECEKFSLYRTSSLSFKIKVKRKNPYYNIARLLNALHKEFKKL